MAIWRIGINAPNKDIIIIPIPVTIILLLSMTMGTSLGNVIAVISPNIMAIITPITEIIGQVQNVGVN